MKKIKWGFIFAILFWFLNINVYALDISYYISSNNLNYEYLPKDKQVALNVSRNDYISVSAIINNSTNYTLNSGKLTLRWEDNLELLAYENGQHYSIDGSIFPNIDVIENVSSNKIILTFNANDLLKVGKNKFFEFKFHVLENAKVGETKIYEMDGEDNLICTSDLSLTPFNCADSLYTELKFNIQKSDVNKLTALKIDGKSLNGFNENNNLYNINVESSLESINIEGIKKDSYSSISGDVGTKKLQYGLNTYNIIVTSESGKKNTYTLNINRLDTRSTINTLETLKLSTGIINFKKEINDYDILVANDVSEITISSSLTDTKSKYEEDYTNKKMTLSQGLNKIQIKVIAENGDINTYTLNITRELSGNNSLKELKVNGDSLQLFESTFNYYYNVSNEITKVKIVAIPVDDNSLVDIKNVDDLEVGNNEIIIKVTAPNHDEISYYLNVYRENILSNNSSLKNLEIKGYNLKFNKDTSYYNLKIKDEEQLDIIPTLEDELSTIEIEGNKNLVNGSIIKITVRAQDNSTTRYFINIEKATKINWFLVIIIILIILIIIAFIILVSLNKKSKAKKKDDKKTLDNKNENIKEESKEDLKSSKENESEALSNKIDVEIEKEKSDS